MDLLGGKRTTLLNFIGGARTRRHCNCQYGSNSLRRERAATIFDCPTTEQHYPFQTYLPHGQ